MEQRVAGVDRAKFAQEMRLKMAEQRISGRAIARQLGVHENSVSNWKAGRALPLDTKFYRLLNILNLNISDLKFNIRGEEDSNA